MNLPGLCLLTGINCIGASEVQHIKYKRCVLTRVGGGRCEKIVGRATGFCLVSENSCNRQQRQSRPKNLKTNLACISLLETSEILWFVV